MFTFDSHNGTYDFKGLLDESGHLNWRRQRNRNPKPDPEHLKSIGRTLLKNISKVPKSTLLSVLCCCMFEAKRDLKVQSSQ